MSRSNISLRSVASTKVMQKPSLAKVGVGHVEEAFHMNSTKNHGHHRGAYWVIVEMDKRWNAKELRQDAQGPVLRDLKLELLTAQERTLQNPAFFSKATGPSWKMPHVVKHLVCVTSHRC